MSDLRALVLSVDNKKHTMLAKADYLVVGQGIKLGAASGSLELGDGTTDVSIPGTLQVTGLMTLHGGSEFQDDITVLGNLQVGTSPYDGSDWVKFNSRVDLNGDTPAVSIPFLKEKNHILSVDSTTTTNTVGGNLTSQAGTGSIASASVGGKQGGHNTTQGGTGGAALASNNNGGAGGHSYLKGGTGGAGALAVTAGGGGNSYVTAGDAGAPGAGTGATGGSVYIEVGSGDIANGSVNIGTGSVTPTAITIGKTGVTTTNSGNLTVSETFTANGNTVLGNATTDRVSFVAQVGPSGSADITFVKAINHAVTVDDSTSTAGAGGELLVRAGKGGPKGIGGYGRYCGGNGGESAKGGDAVLWAGWGGEKGTGSACGKGGTTSVYGGIGGYTAGENSLGGGVDIEGGFGYLTGTPSWTKSGSIKLGTQSYTLDIRCGVSIYFTQNGDGETTKYISFKPAGATDGCHLVISAQAGGADGGGNHDGGNLTMDAGAADGTGVAGNISLGTVNASQVAIGNASGTFRSQAGGNSFVSDISFEGNLGTSKINFPKATSVGDDLEIWSQQGANGSASGDLSLYGAASDTVAGGVNIHGGQGIGTTIAGGDITIDGGSVTALGQTGQVFIGPTNASYVAMGNSIGTVMINSSGFDLQFAGTPALVLNNASQFTCYVDFWFSANPHVIALEDSDDTIDGGGLTTRSGAGGQANGGVAGAVGGVYEAFAGEGGRALAGVGETAALGGDYEAAAGQGGAGNLAGSHTPGVGGRAMLRGGHAGGANGTVGAEGGPVVVASGDGSGDGDSGIVFIDVGAFYGTGIGGGIAIGRSRATRISMGTVGELINLYGLPTIQAGSTLATTSTGNINLPNNTNGGGTRFNIEGSPVTANVTAANLNTLTGGGATALHSHAGTGGAFAGFTKVVGHNVIIGNPVYLYNDTGTTKAKKAEAITNPVVAGIVYEDKSTGDPTQIITSGETPALTDAAWVASTPPVQATDLGKDVYLSTSAGLLTLTPPTANGETVLRLGIVSAGGTGASKIIVMVGESTLIVV